MAMNPNKKTCDNVLESIGNTPMIRLNKVAESIKATVYFQLSWKYNDRSPPRSRNQLRLNRAL